MKKITLVSKWSGWKMSSKKICELFKFIPKKCIINIK